MRKRGSEPEEEEEEAHVDPAKKLEELKKQEIARLEDIRRKAERDKAWFMAHPHRFLRPKENPKGPVFCIVCIQKAHEYWCKVRNEEEDKWKIALPTHIEESIERIDNELRAQTDTEKKAIYEQEALEIVKVALLEEGLVRKNADVDTDNDEDREEKEDKDENNSITSVSMSAADEEIIKWEADMARITNYMDRQGIAFVDARGDSILPPKPAKKAMSIVSSENVMIQMRSTEEDSRITAESPAIKICVFHRNDKGERMKFLGMVELLDRDIRRPPKGIRAYQLKGDDAVIDPEPVPIQGQLALMLAVHSKRGKVGGPGLPNKPNKLRWKLQLKKLSKLHIMDSVDLTNPYCEVYWKGPAQRDGEALFLKEWTLIGQTKSKVRTIEVIYNHREENDNSIFEMPPVWTENNIPFRGLKESDLHFGGGYVARNMIPTEETAENGEIITKSGKKFSFGVTASVEEVQRYRAHVKYKELLAVEIKLRCEAIKLIKMAEERERKFMGEEEKHQRDIEWQNLKLSYAPALQVQETYAKDFQKLLETIVKPSSLLGRLRFLMGEDNMEVSFPNYPHFNDKKGAWKGTPNSLVVRCQDCSTNDVLRVICTPVLSPQDEDSMARQALSLVGRLSLHNIKIMDFAVHDQTTYDAKGFRAVHERIAVIITEHVEGLTMLDYMLAHWDEISDIDFLQIILQIVTALKELHEEGVMHRNLSPHAVQLTFPKGKVSKDSKLVRARLGGYWFLENPRDVSCTHSQGRADWGNRLTTPPEVSMYPKFNKFTKQTPDASPVSDRSDIFALGICIFYWATKGILLPTERYYATNSVAMLKSQLPRKWGGWLTTLLGMCLVIDPNCRPSAKEVSIWLKARRL
ncbi:protein kinase family protein [archaeon]|nr:MAG: protein kinase family protein [archaeon]